MKLHFDTRASARSLLCICATLGALVLSANLTANGLLTPDALNMQLIGHNDLQGRTAYQPTVHVQNGRIFLYVGHFSNQSVLNPLTGVVEPNGTSIVDVTTPSAPVYVHHIPSDSGSQMVRVCDGLTGTLGTTGHYYMLRNTGTTHEVWDVTNTAAPVRLSVIAPPTGIFSATHKSWWECETGIAYIVKGANSPKATSPDGWTTNQHPTVYDLSDPANPVYIRDIGQVGTNPGSTTTPVSNSGVHGPQVTIKNPITGELVNRIYIPYGTSSNGQLSIVDRLKVLPNRNTSAGQPMGGSWDGSRPQNPTDADMEAIVVGSMNMTPTEGGHSTCPVYGMPLKHYKGFTSYNTRDYVILVSEETDNRCTGAPHFAYMVDATRAIGQGATSAGEAHPMAISTMQVFEDSSKPDYCTRGTRFGTHSCNEPTAAFNSITGVNQGTFYPPYYGKLTFVSYFDGGARAFDIRDPYHPQDVAHYVPAVNAHTQATIVGGVTYFDVSSDNLETDQNGLIYDVDRVGGGLDILMLTGPAALIPLSP